jgi:hypothetical protein
LPHHEDFSS